MENYLYSPIRSKPTTISSLPAGIFVSEKSLLRLAGKLGVSDEISARLQSSQSENEVGIVERELEIEGNLENNLFRKMVNNITSCFLLR